jgi:hypothetical protein
MQGSLPLIKAYSVMSTLNQQKSLKALNASGSLKRSKKITASGRLKRELGPHIDPLEALLLSQIQTVPHNDEKFAGYLNQKILLGEVLNENQVRCTLWGFMTLDTRKTTELPDVNVFAFHPHDDKFERYSFDLVVGKAELREEYRKATYNRRAFTALLKVYGKLGSPWS